MKKITIWIALVGLVCFVGCTHGLVFVKNDTLNKVEDNGSDLATVNVQPPQGGYYYQPDVSHNAERIAFVCTSSVSTIPVGDICTAKLDGTDAKKILLPGAKAFPHWSQDRYVVYYEPNKIVKVDALSGGPPVPEDLQHCSFNPCNGGLDLYDGGSKMVFSWRQIISGVTYYYLYAKALPSGPEVPLPAYKPSSATYILEKQPVVSFDGKMLASKVEWPGFEGIRMRAWDDSSNNWGGPFTMNLHKGNINGISFSYKDDKVYFSAESSPSGPKALYYIGLRELMSGILGAMTGPIPPVQDVTPSDIPAGTGANYWPSGINK